MKSVASRRERRRARFVAGEELGSGEERDEVEEDRERVVEDRVVLPTEDAIARRFWEHEAQKTKSGLEKKESDGESGQATPLGALACIAFLGSICLKQVIAKPRM